MDHTTHWLEAVEVAAVLAVLAIWVLFSFGAACALASRLFRTFRFKQIQDAVRVVQAPREAILAPGQAARRARGAQLEAAWPTHCASYETRRLPSATSPARALPTRDKSASPQGQHQITVWKGRMVTGPIWLKRAWSNLVRKRLWRHICTLARKVTKFLNSKSIGLPTPLPRRGIL